MTRHRRPLDGGVTGVDRSRGILAARYVLLV